MVKKEKPKKRKNINWPKWVTFLTGIVLFINIILITNIRITLPSLPKAKYFGSTLEKPLGFLRLPLKVSPLYFIELIIKGPESITYKKNLKFSIKVKEKGKKLIKSPEFRIFIIDSIGQIRSVYPSKLSELIKNDNLNNHFDIKDDIERENIEKDIRFSFEMPLEDQKVLGTWQIFAYLYNYEDKELVSYIINKLDVNETKNIIQSGILILVTMLAVVAFFLFMLMIEKMRILKKRRKMAIMNESHRP